MLIRSQCLYFGVALKKDEAKVNDDGTYTFRCDVPDSIKDEDPGKYPISSIQPYDTSIGAFGFTKGIKEARYESGELVVTSTTMPDVDGAVVVFGIMFTRQPELSTTNTT